MTSTTTTLQLTGTPQRVTARQLADAFGTTTPQGLQVGQTRTGMFDIARIEALPQSVRIHRTNGTNVRPGHSVKLWAMIDGAPTDDVTPAPAPAKKRGGGRKSPAATAQADQQQAQTSDDLAKARARYDELQAKGGLSGKEAKERSTLYALLNPGQSTTASSGPKKAPRKGMDDTHRAVATAANQLANPAAKVTGPNIAHLLTALRAADLSDDRKTIADMKVSTLAKYARSGNRDDLGKAGLSDRFRAVSKKAGPSTFYGKKLAAMLVSVARSDLQPKGR